MDLTTYNNFEKIVKDDIPLIDVRAPIEFEKGAFKNAVNLPLMNNEERHMVGICYKERGNKEAVKLGHELVSGEIREVRINAWVNYLKKYPDSMVYCFRGGLRSKISQQWITEITGKEIVRLEGGYKAFRNYLISQLNPLKQKGIPILIGGFTGSGKTILLRKLPNSIDLEGIANHRGSAFGRQLSPQPTQINFENNLAYALIQHRLNGYKYMILEDEGKNVGKCYLPKDLAAYFKSADLIFLKTPLEERVKITMDEYVYQAQNIYITEFTTEQGLMQWSNYIRDSLSRIKKRLGGDRYKCVIDLFEQAYQGQINSGDFSLHEKWIEVLLRDYYDPMYQHQIVRNGNRIIFEGNENEVLNFLKNKCTENEIY